MSNTSVQTSVVDPAPGAPGMVADVGPKTIESAFASEAIRFGAYVVIDGDSVSLPAKEGDVTGLNGGIAIMDRSNPTQSGGYAKGDIVQVMTFGKVWIETETKLDAGTQPYVRFTADTGKPTGGFREDADTDKAAVPPGLLVKRGTSAAGLAIVDVGRIGPKGEKGDPGD